MRIEVDDVEYTVAMIWLPNDDIHYFLILGNDKIPLELQLHKERHDSNKYLTAVEVREILKLEISKILKLRDAA
jgi:hypothetical protein